MKDIGTLTVLLQNHQEEIKKLLLKHRQEIVELIIEPTKETPEIPKQVYVVTLKDWSGYDVVLTSKLGVELCFDTYEEAYRQLVVSSGETFEFVDEQLKLGEYKIYLKD